MRTADVWFIIVAILILALISAIIWLFWGLELKFPGSEHLSPKVRRQLGISVLISAAITTIATLIIARLTIP